ncbi:MAG: retropepsin-like aspartic protease [Terracidiphilus sp.]
MKSFAFAFLAALAVAAVPVYAQPGCPANVKAIPFRSIDHHQIIVSVSVNHSGPYDFLLDTGTQTTVLDQSLASELGVSSTGNATVAGLSFKGGVTYANLASLEVGDHRLTNQSVLVYDMKDVQAAGFSIRGLLGDDFLSRYDVFIDHRNSLLCMDDTGSMSGSLADASPTARR